MKKGKNINIFRGKMVIEGKSWPHLEKTGPKRHSVPRFGTKQGLKGEVCAHFGQNWLNNPKHAKIWAKNCPKG